MFKVEIMTPNGPFATYEAEILNVITTEGQIGLLTNHMPYIANLKAGELNLVSNKNRLRFNTGAGTVFFKDNLAKVLVETIEQK